MFAVYLSTAILGFVSWGKGRRIANAIEIPTRPRVRIL